MTATRTHATMRKEDRRRQKFKGSVLRSLRHPDDVGDAKTQDFLSSTSGRLDNWFVVKRGEHLKGSILEFLVFCGF